MNNLGYLIAKKEELEAKALKLSNEIETMEETVKEAVAELSKDGGSFGGVTVSGGGGKPSADKNGIIDYSVTMDDLDVYKTVTTKGGETYQIYKSDKTDALYIISSIPDNNKNNIIKKDLYVSLKDVLNEDEMVIITFDGKPYKGDVYNSIGSTKDFGFVAKNDEGKMLSFYNTQKMFSKIPKKEPVVSYNGLVMPKNGSISVETGAKFDMKVLYQNEYAKNLSGDLIINQQVGLVACQLHVQKKRKNATKERPYDQDTSARFVIQDKVLESFCDRIDNENSYLTALNRNNYGKETAYHTIFEGCGDNFNDKYPEGYLGTHSNVFGVTLETNHKNEKWNNFCFTLEAIAPNGVVCQKEVWATENSYIVDDWNHLETIK